MIFTLRRTRTSLKIHRALPWNWSCIITLFPLLLKISDDTTSTTSLSHAWHQLLHLRFPSLCILKEIESQRAFSHASCVHTTLVRSDQSSMGTYLIYTVLLVLQQRRYAPTTHQSLLLLLCGRRFQIKATTTVLWLYGRKQSVVGPCCGYYRRTWSGYSSPATAQDIPHMEPWEVISV
jgi:hypothetical protein